MKRVLALAPHTDDVELGCGGTLARLLEEGASVTVAAFSTCRESIPSGLPPDIAGAEFARAMRLLGVPGDDVLVYDYPVRKFSYHRQDLLEDLVRLRSRIRPDLVLLPSEHDIHQDHQVIAAEGLRAFKETSVWGYELPWNQTAFTAQAFVTLERRHIEAKWRALGAYRTQVDLGRSYFRQDFIEGLARVRGVQVKAEFAEAFEVVRLRV
ncbi:MAG: LmbE family protein [Symbiobacteriaceae bacterium]|jgi:LmbE family N-acetylglucosaminyl deacetylase|nr:LmbE family protein [Symbiobacteriaceae bacterium]